jgi:hypothetical protein
MAWTTPITWSNGAVTAATMNTELRDHLNWLKGALDLITAASAADSGTATKLSITRASTTSLALESKVSGDAGTRFQIAADGGLGWGSGSGTPVEMLFFGDGTTKFVRTLVCQELLKLRTKAGTFSDADIEGTYTGGTSGLMGVDTTNSRLYVKVGATWKFAALT